MRVKYGTRSWWNISGTFIVSNDITPIINKINKSVLLGPLSWRNICITRAEISYAKKYFFLLLFSNFSLVFFGNWKYIWTKWLRYFKLDFNKLCNSSSNIITVRFSNSTNRLDDLHGKKSLVVALATDFNWL